MTNQTNPETVKFLTQPAVATDQDLKVTSIYSNKPDINNNETTPAKSKTTPIISTPSNNISEHRKSNISVSTQNANDSNQTI